MKKTLCLSAMCTCLMLLSISAAAQDLSLFNGRSLETGIAPAAHNAPGAPKYCSPCLFYGGDWFNTDANWLILADADVPAFNGPVALYTPFAVPKGKTWTVTSIFSNVGFININKMDPAKPEWSINSGVKSGSGGKVIAHGKTTKGTAKATGRTAQSGAGSVTEYTVALKLPKAVTLAGGKTYWESVVPPCTNTKDSACATALYFETDTYDTTDKKQGAHAFGPPQPKGLSFLNSPVNNVNFQQINASYCSANGFMTFACNFWSAGVIGTQK